MHLVAVVWIGGKPQSELALPIGPCFLHKVEVHTYHVHHDKGHSNSSAVNLLGDCAHISNAFAEIVPPGNHYL
jgi:hypothetical protein